MLVGGGVRGVEDLRRLKRSGASAVLVASALHDGRLTPGAAAEFSGRPAVGDRGVEREEKLDRSAAKGTAGS